MAWSVLEFDWDDVVGLWQDQRLARVTDAAWRSAGSPAAFRIVQAPGDGEILIVWYVNEFAAELLDREGIAWRSFVVGTCAAPPASASTMLAAP